MFSATCFLTLVLFVSLGITCLLDNDRSSIYVSVLENAAPGSALTELPIQGVTFGPEPDTQLKLVKGNEIVDLDARQKKLILKKALDRDEGESKFEVVIECKSLTDSDFPQINISTFVSVLDVNDNAPEFDSDAYHFSVPEELPVGTIVFTELKATDRDQAGPNSYLSYRILPGENSHYLAITEPTDPTITIAERIDFEKITSFDILIEAKDDGDPVLSTIVKAHVTVTDIDDLNPIFNYDYYSAAPYKSGIIEVSPERIHAVDGDTIGADIVYSLHGEYSDYFSIDKSGTVSTVTEIIPSAVLIVKAQQTDWADRFATAVLKVSNDSFIHFELPIYSIRVMSNSEINSEIIRLKALSPEKEADITYSLNDTNREATFTMSPKTGAIKVSKPIRRSYYSYKVSANDGKRIAHSRIDIYIVGSHAPTFDKDDYSFDVNNSPFVGQVHASDADINDTVTYSIANLQKLFTIDKEGCITRIGELPPYSELVVICEDSSAQRAVTTVTIKSSQPFISMATLLTALIFILLIIISLVIIVFIAKRISLICRKEECWMSKTGDNAIVISASLDSDNLQTLSMKRTAHKEFENENSDRENGIKYASSMAFGPSPSQSPPQPKFLQSSVHSSRKEAGVVLNKKPTVYF